MPLIQWIMQNLSSAISIIGPVRLGLRESLVTEVSSSESRTTEISGSISRLYTISLSEEEG